MKHLLLSKTFWLNIAGLGLTLGNVLPPKYSVPTIALANVINRFFTNQPIWLFTNKEN